MKAVVFGGQLGGALGYRQIFIGLELTVVRFFSTAHLDLGGQRRDVHVGGILVYPGIAVMGEF